MSQISRPFQIALLAVAVLGAAWLFVFQPHPSSTATSSSSSAVVSAPPASSASNTITDVKRAGSPSKIYHGSAPGVQGLTRAVAHAHEAVATSQQNAHTLEQKSAQASGDQAGKSAASATPTGASATKSTATHAKSAPSIAKTSTPAPMSHAPRSAGTHPSIPAGQRAVETELAHGNVVVVLFWNHNGTDDQAVRQALRSLPAAHPGKIAIHVATPSQTASFGSITRGVQIYGTPTTLVIDKHGKAIVLTGLQDAFSIRQAIAEARSVS